MKFRSVFSCAAIAAGLLLSWSAVPAEAETVFHANYDLKALGVDMQTTEIVSISPDNKFLCCLQRFRPVQGQKAHNTFYIIQLSSSGSIVKVREFPVEGIGNIGQISFTPDSKHIVFTTLEGSKLVRMDCDTGELNTIMEHVPGKAGFVVYPQVLKLHDDKLLALGYHYNSEDFVGPQAIAEVDTDKSGLDAFKNARLIDHVQAELHKPKYYAIREGFPALDVGFVTGFDLDNTYCEIFSWDGERGIIELIESCKGFEDEVYGGTRTVYSVQDDDGTYRLCVYDAKTDEKVVLSSGRQKPCYYTLMSDDGSTITFNEQTGEAEKYTTFYARESEGWKIKPIEGLEKRMSFGRQRLSYDGRMMVFHNDDGLRIVKLKAPNKY